MTLERLTKIRRDLHQIPEIGFDLEKTYAYVKNELESMGFKPLTYAKTGLVVVIEGLSKEAIAFRADMDGLPVLEGTKVDFESKHVGNMHACGHDGHTTMLLGFAEYLSNMPKPNQTIVLIFQPAEEGPGGASVIIKEGLFKDYNIKEIHGLHLFPGLDEGIVGLKRGPMLARNAEFDFIIHGKSSHGAQPQSGIDAVLAASQFVVLLNQIVSRYIDPLEPAVITTGKIEGGEARNIIANKVKISGTIRAFNDQIFELLKRKMMDAKLSIESFYGVSIDDFIVDYYPAVDNDSALYEEVKASLKDHEIVELKPMMFSEDFAFYQKEVPGVFSFIGTKNVNKDFIHPLHSNFFNFDEKVLLNGLKYFIDIVQYKKIF